MTRNAIALAKAPKGNANVSKNRYPGGRRRTVLSRHLPVKTINRRAENSGIRLLRRYLTAIAVCCLWALTGCGTDNGGPPSDKGYLTFKAVPQAPPGRSDINAPVNKNLDLCKDYGIDTIHAYILNSAGTQIANDETECIKHKATMMSVPSGENCQLFVEAWLPERNEPTWVSQPIPINIRSGLTTHAGDIKLYLAYNGTDSIAPTVEIEHDKFSDGSIPGDVVFTLKFSEPVVRWSVNADNCRLVGPDNSEVNCDILCEDDESAEIHWMTMTPREALQLGQKYRLVVDGVEDLAGNMVAREWAFDIAAGWKTVSAGYSYGTGIRKDGSLWAWGLNAFNQLGLDNTTTWASVPFKIDNEKNWASLSSSMDLEGLFFAGHTLAIKNDGSLWAWGDNRYGQLGLGSLSTISSTPKHVKPDVQFKKVAVGLAHSLAISRDDTIWAWGANDNGQLGIGDTGAEEKLPTPREIEGHSNWRAVAAGIAHTLALKAVITNDKDCKSGCTLWAWGNNEDGQLGITGESTIYNNPQQVGTSKNWKFIAANDNTSFAINDTGELFVWGLNNNCQFGPTTINSSSEPIKAFVEDNQNWQMISVGHGHVIGIKKDGAIIYTWGGINEQGQLGNGTLEGECMDGTPINAVDGESLDSPIIWQTVFAGALNSFAIDSNGQFFSWGFNDQGQSGHRITVPIPRLINYKDLKWESVSAGETHNMAITQDNQLYAWGTNSYGQLGDGTYNESHIPIKIGNDDIKWAEVSTGSVHTVAIDQQSNIYSWGDNWHGKLGIPSLGENINTPTMLTRESEGWKGWQQIAAGEDFTLALNEENNGTVWGWGDNWKYQLGLLFEPDNCEPNNADTDGICRSIEQPIQLDQKLQGVKQIAAGNGFGVAILKKDPQLKKEFYPIIWGVLSEDQPPYLNPTIIETHNNLMNIAAGDWHVLGLNDSFKNGISGYMYSWGNNTMGQLGLGEGYNFLGNPERLKEINNWTWISAGGSHSLGIRDDGTMMAWGSNVFGQLGDGTFISRVKPVEIPHPDGNGSRWIKVSAGYGHTAAIDDSNRLWTWGSNFNFTLGYRTGSILSPKRVW